MPTQIGENRAKKMLKANELVLCMGVNQLRTPNIAMIAAACGFDAVYIDLEHNPTSLETAAGVCVAALGMGITPIARVTSHDPHDATRILDCGAQGVMVPHIQNAAEARAIVEACLYAPKGHRSAFGSGPQLGYAAIPQAEVCKILNEQTMLMARSTRPRRSRTLTQSPRSTASMCCTLVPRTCRPRWAFPGNTRTNGCAPPSRPSPERRRATAKQWGSVACARISSSRAGCCDSVCAT